MTGDTTEGSSHGASCPKTVKDRTVAAAGTVEVEPWGAGSWSCG